MDDIRTNRTGGNVVAALDGTPKDRAVAAWAAAQARRTGSALRLVSVVDAGLQLTPYEALAAGSPSLAEQVDADVHHQLDELAQSLKAATPELEVSHDVPWGSPAAGLVEAAETARLLVMGSPVHAGFGSVVVPVMAHAQCPVVIVPEGSEEERPRTVVVGVDGSEPSRRALDFALETVEPDGGSVYCVLAYRPEVNAELLINYQMSEPVSVIDERFGALLDDVIAETSAAHPGVTMTPSVRHGNTPKQLLEVADRVDADLVVVGSRGHGGFVGLLLGSVSRRVVARAELPVAVVS